MKIVVSLPDEVFCEAEAAAKRLRVSRSRLYTTAIAEFLDRHLDQSITERRNQIYSRNDSRLDPILNRAELKSVHDESW